jgi:DNA-binding HxlR family transcriptional regulator
VKQLPRSKARPKASERVCNIEVDGEMLCVYPLDDVMEQLGKRWTLLLVGSLGRGRRRFNEVQTDLAGVSSRTLSERLKALEELGIVEREAFNEVPLRVEYSLSAEGRRLLDAMAPLLRWAAAR